MESADSIRSLYRHFLSGITTKSLNAFYYVCSYAKVDYSAFMNVTARLALKLIPADLESQPLFLCIDDTMVSKFGKKFEDVSKLFDHAIQLPKWALFCQPYAVCAGMEPRQDFLPCGPARIPYVAEKESKLELASAMVRQVMP